MKISQAKTGELTFPFCDQVQLGLQQFQYPIVHVPKIQLLFIGNGTGIMGVMGETRVIGKLALHH